MKRILVLLIVLLVFIPLSLVSQTPARNADAWQPLRFLQGTWEADKPGVSKTAQIYSFVLKGKYLHMKTKSVFEPTEKKPKGEIHEDFGVFSIDKARKKFVLRGFYVEGFVNRYIADAAVPADGKTFTFESEAVENAPPGTRAKIVIKKTGANHMEQSFFVAWPNKDYNCFFINKYKRVK